MNYFKKRGVAAMTRNELIDHMTTELMDSDCINIDNFHDAESALDTVRCIIRHSLQDYMIIQGTVLESE